MALLVVGSVALDSLETPFGRREEVLGGSASYFSACASFFGPTRLVAVVGEDFPEEHVRFLAGRGVDLAGLSRRPGRTFRWRGRYEFDLNTAHTLDTQLNVFAHFQPELPAHFRGSEYVFLGNIDPDLQRAVLDQVERPRFVGCDTMNYWITSKRESLLKTMAYTARRIPEISEVNNAGASAAPSKPAARFCCTTSTASEGEWAAKACATPATIPTASPTRPALWPSASTKSAATPRPARTRNRSGGTGDHTPRRGHRQVGIRFELERLSIEGAAAPAVQAAHYRG